MTSDGIKHNWEDLAAIMECLCERPSIQSKTPNKKPVKYQEIFENWQVVFLNKKCQFIPWLEAIASCFRNLPRITAKTESTGSLALINLVPPIKYKGDTK